MYGELGTQWTRMVEFLPGRTENSIKNRFYSSLRKYVKHNDALKEAEIKSEASVDERMMALLKTVEDLEQMLMNTRQELIELEGELDLK